MAGSGQEQPDDLEAPIRHLRQGGVVAFPTDTLYGLGADVFNEAGLRRIFNIKGRPENLALPVLVAHVEQAATVTQGFDQGARQLASVFWPGSLTLVLPKSSALSPLVTGGRDTVAVRLPDHWVPRQLAAGLGHPITGTSANRSGQPDLLSIAQVRKSLGDAVNYVVDAGPAPLGRPSTVVDLSNGSPTLIREGAIPFADVMQAWNQASQL